MVLKEDGTVAQEAPAADESKAGVKGLVAVARYVPFHITVGFRQRFGFAA